MHLTPIDCHPLNPIWHPNAGVICGEAFYVAGDKQHRMYLGGGPDDCIRQLQTVLLSQADRTFGDFLVQFDPFETVEELASGAGCGLGSADQHLHPGDDADGPVFIPFQFVAGSRNELEKVDQDVGVEERFYHSARTFS